MMNSIKEIAEYTNDAILKGPRPATVLLIGALCSGRASVGAYLENTYKDYDYLDLQFRTQWLRDRYGRTIPHGVMNKYVDTALERVTNRDGALLVKGVFETRELRREYIETAQEIGTQAVGAVYFDLKDSTLHKRGRRSPVRVLPSSIDQSIDALDFDPPTMHEGYDFMLTVTESEIDVVYG